MRKIIFADRLSPLSASRLNPVQRFNSSLPPVFLQHDARFVWLNDAFQCAGKILFEKETNQATGLFFGSHRSAEIFESVCQASFVRVYFKDELDFFIELPELFLKNIRERNDYANHGRLSGKLFDLSMNSDDLIVGTDKNPSGEYLDIKSITISKIVAQYLLLDAPTCIIGIEFSCHGRTHMLIRNVHDEPGPIDFLLTSPECIKNLLEMENFDLF